MGVPYYEVAEPGADRIAFAAATGAGADAFRLTKWLATDPDGDLVLGWAWAFGAEPLAERSRATLMRG